MLQSLEDRDQRYRERGQKNVDRHIALRFRQRIVLAQNQSLHAAVNQVGDKTRRERRNHPAHDDRSDLAPLDGINADANSRKTDDGANNRMRRRDRPAVLRGNQQPGTRGKQRSQHAVRPASSAVVDAHEQVGIDNAFANGAGDCAAGQHGPGKFEDGGNDDRLLDRQRFGANRRCHRVGNVIGTDAPGHKQAKSGRKHDIDSLMLPFGRPPGMRAFPNFYSLLVLREQQLESAADAFRHVGDFAGQLDDFIEKHGINRVQRFFDFEQRGRGTASAVRPYASRSGRVPRSARDTSVTSAPLKPGREQLVEFAYALACLLGGIDIAVDKLEKLRGDCCRDLSSCGP